MLLATACKREMEKPQWDTNILAPFVSTELGIDDIVKNGVTQTNSDQSVDLFIRDTLYTLPMDSLITIETPQFDVNRTLDSIKFDTAPIVTKITLGQIARQMQRNGSTFYIGSAILASQGNTISAPTITGITGGPIPINISTILQQADIKTGFLDITVDNGLPLDISHIEFQIKNVTSPYAVIAQPVMDSIFKNTSKTVSEDISGKHVDSVMNANILDMDFSGGNAKIDTNDAVTITLKVRNVTVSAATAIFPAQNVINDASVNYLLNMGSVKLKQIKIASGTVRIEVGTSLPDSLFFSYGIPGAEKNGVPFQVQTGVPPQVSGTVVFTYDMAGYTMSLRGDPSINTDYNGIYNTLVGRIKYTGQIVHLSLSDYVHVKISLDKVKPSYVNGYLGDTSISISGTMPLTVFNHVTGGNLQFDNADAAVIIDNSFGVPGSATINNVTVHNGSNSASASSGTVALGKGIDGNPPTVTSSSITVNNSTALVNVMPKTVDYSGVLKVNPTGAFDDNQFAYAAYPVKAYLQFHMPLSLTANQLQLTDTIALTSNPQLTGALKKGKLNLIVDNGFPFAAQVHAYFLDGSHQVMDSLVTTQSVESASKDVNGKVTEAKRTVVTYNLSPGTIGNIQNAKFVIFKAAFDTGGTHSKIYSDYRIKFKLAGDVQYTVNGQQ